MPLEIRLHLLVFVSIPVSTAEIKRVALCPNPHSYPALCSAIEGLSLSAQGSGMMQLKLDLGKNRQVGRFLSEWVRQSTETCVPQLGSDWHTLCTKLTPAQAKTQQLPRAALAIPHRATLPQPPSRLHTLLLPCQSQAAGTDYRRLLQDACPLASATQLLSDGCTGKCFSLSPH